MNLHTNDVRALRDLLDDVYNGRAVNRRHLNVLLEMCNEEVDALYARLEREANAEQNCMVNV